jgi:proteasome lid subunit RPN8/RPN11
VIVLPGPGRARIMGHARTAYPHECCGLLVGERAAGAVRVTGVVATANVAEDRPGDRFEVDPQARFDLMRALDGTGGAIVGHYHSHPDGPAEPSETDRSLAFEPDLVWLICAVTAAGPQDMTAWRIPVQNAAAVPVPLTEGGDLSASIPESLP